MTKDAYTSLRILLADDDAYSLTILVNVLNNIGIKNIVLAGDGREALDKLASTAEPIDIVISDIEMPGMGGFELAHMIRRGTVAKYKDVPFLMLTGHSDEENVRKGRSHRIQGFIVKPPTAEILERYIERALKKQ
jgi:CheY-like chemotaxis protein